MSNHTPMHAWDTCPAQGLCDGECGQAEASDRLPGAHPLVRCYGNCQLPVKREYPEAVDPMGTPVNRVVPVSPVYFPVPPVHWKSPSHRG